MAAALWAGRDKRARVASAGIPRCDQASDPYTTAPSNLGQAPGDGRAPRGWSARSVRSASATQRMARGVLALVALLLLAAVGVKATLAPHAVPRPAARAPRAAADDIAVQRFAQAFARA